MAPILAELAKDNELGTTQLFLSTVLDSTVGFNLLNFLAVSINI